MLLIVIRILFAVACAGAIAAFISNPPVDLATKEPTLPSLAAHPMAWFTALFLLTQAGTIVDLLIKRKRVEIVSSVYFGLLIGFLLSYLTNLALAPIVDKNWQPVTQMLTNLMLPYLCISLLMQTKDDFRFIIPFIEFSREVKGGRPYLLDTSSIIDGRIADVIETRIIESPLVVPSFVLQELQDIADSNDKLRRNRGRRGLDVLSRLQSNTLVEVRLLEAKPEDGKATTVDQRLVELAKKIGGRVITNDFNLNKVANVQGVDVVNLNDLANSLKPRYLPGERLMIKIIKPGESAGQGVGYLDDGTMVVCEDGGGMIGRESEIVVKSVLQSSAGRMIFGRLPTNTDR